MSLYLAKVLVSHNCQNLIKFAYNYSVQNLPARVLSKFAGALEFQNGGARTIHFPPISLTRFWANNPFISQVPTLVPRHIVIITPTELLAA